MKTPPVPFDSDALRANIASTAQDVVIPDRYQPLVDAVEGLYGVRASLVETMGEYFHAFRNADPLIDGFQTTLLHNWTHFETSDDRAELFGLLAELVLGLLESPLSADQFSLALRELLMWCAAALDGPTARPTTTPSRRSPARSPGCSTASRPPFLSATRCCATWSSGSPRARRRRRPSASSTARCCWSAIAGSTSASTCRAGRASRSPA